MPLQTYLTIGTTKLDLAPKNAHSVAEEALGPTGEVNFSTKNWGKGMLSVEQGLEHADGFYLSAQGVDAALSNQLILQPQATTVAVSGGGSLLAAPLKQVDISTTSLLATSGRYAYNLNGSNQWVQSFDAGSGNSIQDVAVFGSQVAVAYTGAYAGSSTAVASTWTVASTAVDRWGVLLDKVYRATRPNTLYTAQNSFGGSYDSGSSIADTSYNINSITGHEQMVFIGKEDGVYSIDYEGLVVPFTPELRSQANANFASVQAAVVFNGDYYFRTLNGLIQISGNDSSGLGMKRRVGLDQLSSPNIPTPVIKALASDDRYLYAFCQTTGTTLQIFRRSIAGAWHSFWYATFASNVTAQYMAVSGVLGYPALFFGYTDTTANFTIKYIRLSTFPNPLQDSNYRYDTTSQNYWIRLGRVGSALAPCILDRCTIQSRNLGPSITVTPYYAVDGGGITQFGSSAATSSPLTTIDITTPVAGHLWDLYLYLSTNDATTTPVVTGMSFKGRWRPATRRVHTFRVLARAYQPARSGGAVRQSASEIISTLNTLRTTNAYVTCTDEQGISFSAVVESVNRLSGDMPSPQVGTGEPPEMFEVKLVEATSAGGALTFAYDQAVYS